MAKSSTLATRVATLEKEVARLRRLLEKRPASRNGSSSRRPPRKKRKDRTGTHPFSAWAGWLRDDPMIEEYQRAIKDYRRQRDADEDAL